MMELLDLVVRMDKAQALKARDMIDARLRELDERAEFEINLFDAMERAGAERVDVSQGLEPCMECGIISANHALDGHHEHMDPRTKREGLELEQVADFIPRWNT